MKHFTKYIAIIMLIAMTFAAFGCDLSPAETTEPETEIQEDENETVDATENGSDETLPKESDELDVVETEPNVTDTEQHTHDWNEASCTEPKTCSSCGATEGESLGGHIGGQATCKARAKCERCGKVYGAAGKHLYEGKVAENEYIVSSATMTKPATYYYSCIYCGDKGTQTFSAGGTIIESLINPYNQLFVENADAEGYLYFTDPHPVNCAEEAALWSGREERIDTLGQLYSYSNATFAICGGDWFNNSNNKESAMSMLKWIRQKMTTTFGEKSYLIVGNHDYNYQYVSGGQNGQSPYWLTADEMVECWFSEYGKTYYTYTTDASRFYVFDSGVDWGHGSLTALDKEQIVWLLEELSKNDDKHIVMAPHMIYTSGTTVNPGTQKFAEISAIYNARGTYTYNGVTYDFSGKTGRVEYFIAGHTHADKTFTLEGIPVILVDSMQKGSYPTSDLIYVNYDERKVYLKRIGDGTDRVVDLIP